MSLLTVKVSDAQMGNLQIIYVIYSIAFQLYMQSFTISMYEQWYMDSLSPVITITQS